MAEKQSPAQPIAEVDRIRDILFGTQMRGYDQRLAEIQRDLDRLQKEIDHLTEQLSDQDASQTKKTQALRKELRQADDELRSELRETGNELAGAKVERQALADLFTQLADQLKGGGGLGDVLGGLSIPEKD